jgi:hypothetical protein
MYKFDISWSDEETKKKGGGRIKAVTQRTENAMATNGQKYKQ